MTMPRRSFLKTTLAAGATGAFVSPLAAQAGPTDREFYELRCYRLQAGTRLKQDPNAALLDGYLEGALLPALDSLGVKNVGVFTELDVDKTAGTRAPKAGSPVWVLIPYASLAAQVQVASALAADAAHQQKGGEYLKIPKATPAFERIDSWLYLAFKSMPKMELPAFSRARTATRVFEMRDYESHSELAALNKMAMFDDGETQLMLRSGHEPDVLRPRHRRTESPAPALHDGRSRPRDSPRRVGQVRPGSPLAKDARGPDLQGQHVAQYGALPYAEGVLPDLSRAGGPHPRPAAVRIMGGGGKDPPLPRCRLRHSPSP